MSKAESEQDATAPQSPEEIAAEWAEDYPPGAELFCAAFGADDFDQFWGATKHPDGETIAVQIATRPSSGFFARHRDKTPMQLGFDVIEHHMSERAWALFCDLNDEAQDEFVKEWIGDTFDEPAGKATGFNRSSRRAASKRRRSAATS